MGHGVEQIFLDLHWLMEGSSPII